MDDSRSVRNEATLNDGYVTLQEVERECRLSGTDFFALLISGRTVLERA